MIGLILIAATASAPDMRIYNPLQDYSFACSAYHPSGRRVGVLGRMQGSETARFASVAGTRGRVLAGKNLPVRFDKERTFIKAETFEVSRRDGKDVYIIDREFPYEGGQRRITIISLSDEAELLKSATGFCSTRDLSTEEYRK